MTSEDQNDPGMNRRTWGALLAIGLLAAVLHMIHLGVVLGAGAKDDMAYHHWSDTPTYLRMADAFAAGNRMPDPTYQERVLFPWLLEVFRSWTGQETAVLWVIALLELPATVALGALAFMLCGKGRAAVLSASLYALYPLTYKYGPLLQTDALHVQLLVMAMAATLWWVSAPRIRRGLVAGLLWALVLAVRPSAMPLVPLLLLFGYFSWRRGSGVVAAISAGLPAVLFVAFWIVSNAIVFGIPRFSLHTPEFLKTWVVPYLDARSATLQGRGDFTPLFLKAQSEARNTDEWRALHFPEDASAFTEAYRLSSEENAGALRGRRMEIARVVADSLPGLVAEPTRFHAYRTMESRCALPQVFLKAGHWFLLGLFFAGLFQLFLMRRAREYVVLFILFCIASLPLAVLSVYFGLRLRYPCDVLALPMAVIAMTAWPGWACGAASAGTVFLLRRVFGFMSPVAAAMVPAVFGIVAAIASAFIRRGAREGQAA